VAIIAKKGENTRSRSVSEAVRSSARKKCGGRISEEMPDHREGKRAMGQALSKHCASCIVGASVSGIGGIFKPN
jgi:hypothetical protein